MGLASGRGTASRSQCVFRVGAEQASVRHPSVRGKAAKARSHRLRFPCILDRSLESPFRATPENELVSGARRDSATLGSPCQQSMEIGRGSTANESISWQRENATGHCGTKLQLPRRGGRTAATCRRRTKLHFLSLGIEYGVQRFAPEERRPRKPLGEMSPIRGLGIPAAAALQPQPPVAAPQVVWRSRPGAGRH